MISDDKKAFFVAIPKNASTTITGYLSKNGFRHPNGKHSMYCSYAPRIGTDVRFRKYYSFCFVRNTWARLLSEYNFQKRYSKYWFKRTGLRLSDMSFPEFVKTFVKEGKPFSNHIPPRNSYDMDWGQLQFINKDVGKGKVNCGVSFVGRVENLQGDMERVCDRLNMEPIKFPTKNRTKHKHYTEVYDDESRKIVANLYSEEIEYFNFSYEQ